jgi:hypothetical protein
MQPRNRAQTGRINGKVMDGHKCGRAGEIIRDQMKDKWMSAAFGYWVGQWKAGWINSQMC